jgi:hypothetical protein
MKLSEWVEKYKPKDWMKPSTANPELYHSSRHCVIWREDHTETYATGLADLYNLDDMKVSRRYDFAIYLEPIQPKWVVVRTVKTPRLWPSKHFYFFEDEAEARQFTAGGDWSMRPYDAATDGRLHDS